MQAKFQNSDVQEAIANNASPQAGGGNKDIDLLLIASNTDCFQYSAMQLRAAFSRCGKTDPLYGLAGNLLWWRRKNAGLCGISRSVNFG